MTVKKFYMPLIVALALFGTVGVAMLTGDWQTSGKTLIAANAQLTADDLKGWMTLQQAADGLRLPVETVRELAGIPQGSPITNTTALKDLEAQLPGFEVSVLRERVKAHQAGQPLPPTPAAETTTTTTAPGGSTAPSAPPATPATPQPAPAPAPAPPTAHVPRGSGGGTGPGRNSTTTAP